MDIKNFILIGGGLLIIAVILHGFWVAWRARREPLRLDIAPDFVREDIDEMELLRGELPNGGARVQREEPEQVSFELEAPATPVEPLVTSPPTERAVRTRADAAPVRKSSARVADVEIPASSETDAKDVVGVPPEPAATGGRRFAEATSVSDPESLATEPAEPAPEPPEPEAIVADREPTSRAGKADSTAGRKVARVRGKPQPTRAVRDVTGEVAVVPELVVLHVLNPKNPYNGSELFNILRAHKLKYGDMNIFHRKDAVTGASRYSIASAVEPGTFDLSDMDNYATPGLSFFMKLTQQTERPRDVFEDMLKVANDVRDSLGGEMKDEQMNLMTAQTVEHYRARIADFTRRRLTATGGSG